MALSLALALEPLFELGCACDEKPIQQVSAIQLQCCMGLPGIELGFERLKVDPCGLGSDSHFLVATTHDDSVPKRRPNHVKRLTQCVSRVSRVELRPEQPHELVAAMQCARLRDREIHQQRHALRLTRQRFDTVAIGTDELQTAEKPQFDHDVVLARA